MVSTSVTESSTEPETSSSEEPVSTASAPASSEPPANDPELDDPSDTPAAPVTPVRPSNEPTQTDRMKSAIPTIAMIGGIVVVVGFAAAFLITKFKK